MQGSICVVVKGVCGRRGFRKGKHVVLLGMCGVLGVGAGVDVFWALNLVFVLFTLGRECSAPVCFVALERAWARGPTQLVWPESECWQTCVELSNA